MLQRADSLEKTLMLGKIEARRRRRCQSMRWLDGITTQWTWVWASFGRWWRIGKSGVLQSIGHKRVGHNWVTKQQQHLKQQWLVYISIFPPYHFIHIKDLWSFSISSSSSSSFFFFFDHILHLVGSSLTWDWSNPSPLQWKHEILTTGPPEKSHYFLI